MWLRANSVVRTEASCTWAAHGAPGAARRGVWPRWGAAKDASLVQFPGLQAFRWTRGSHVGLLWDRCGAWRAEKGVSSAQK
jgi:hypothetical protein